MRKRKKYVILAAILFVLPVGICDAEPDGTIKYLMNEPVTLLDFGLFNLNKHLEMAYSEYHSAVHYIWKENRIVVYVEGLLAKHEYKNEEKAKKESKKVVNKIGRFLGFDPAKWPLTDGVNSLDLYFRHTGYTIKSAPKNLSIKLSNITEIRDHTYYNDDKKHVHALYFKANLLGTGMNYAINEPEKLDPKSEIEDEPKKK